MTPSWQVTRHIELGEPSGPYEQLATLTAAVLQTSTHALPLDHHEDLEVGFAVALPGGFPAVVRCSGDPLGRSGTIELQVCGSEGDIRLREVVRQYLHHVEEIAGLLCPPERVQVCADDELGELPF